MKDILSITVDDTMEHGMCEKRVYQFVPQMQRNEQKLGFNIFKVNMILKFSEDCTGCANLTRLSNRLLP